MRKITLGFSGFWKNYVEEHIDNFAPLKILRKHYDVIIDNKNPEYIFCSIFEGFDYLKYDGVRIFCFGEAYAPNFNFADYAIGYDRLDYHDRYLRLPNLFDFKSIEVALQKHKNIESDVLNNKKKFCNFLFSNPNDLTGRKELFDYLSQYKFIEAASKVRKNCSLNVPATNKISYQSEFKFSIAYENEVLPEYCTEKMTDAFAACTIPIYKGDPFITEIFNEKAFINCNNKSNSEILEIVKELDNNDNLYLEYLYAPAFINANYLEEINLKLEKFLLNIFEQDYKKSFRRGNSTVIKGEIEILKNTRQRVSFFGRIKNKLNKSNLK